jgi:hypothetical protein
VGQAFAVAGESPSRGDAGGLVADWDAHGGWITAEWIERYPGRRPWAWWALEAPGPANHGRRGLSPGAKLWRLAYGRPFNGIASSWARRCFSKRSSLPAAARAPRSDERRRLTAQDYEPQGITIIDDEEEEEHPR